MHSRKKNKYCIEILICPYYHESDSDCGKDGVRMMLDEKLITDYYKSLIVSYENSIDNENKKLNDLESKFVCYICGEKHTNALNDEGFLVDKKENKIVCGECANRRRINFIEVGW